MIELYAEFEQQSGLGAVGEEVNVNELGDIDWEEDNNDSEEEFEANYEVDDENDDGDLVGNPEVQNEANAIVSQHPFDVSSFMRTLDLEAIHVLEFPEYANTGEGNTVVEDGEFSVGMEFGSRESLISAIKSYTISRGVDYTVYKFEPQTFYAKCKDAIRPLVELNPTIKVKSVIAEVQYRFNYTMSYRKAWLAKQKAVAKVFSDWEVSYQTLPVWLKAMTVKMPRSPFRHYKPLVQVDGTHLYRKNKGALLVAVAQDGNQNIVPIAFAIVEGETADAWEFFLTNLWRYVVTIDGVGIISDRHTSIDVAIARSNGAWSPPGAWHMYCIRHIGSNFLRKFKAPYLHKLMVNTCYSRTEQEYNKNYQRLKERGEAYTQWCDEIGVERWVLALDGGQRWGHMTTNLVECINSVLKGARNLLVTALVRSTFYRLNELFTRKCIEAHERLRNGFKYSEFATKRVEESFRRAGNVVVNRFDRHNEMF
ncbi:uncharacterized protein LOC130949421 [Arachis stenosperma]|uniref:uncharacterized protein LOC130949421 n=1 Tax=Arachis stenosperma TaxID=217475 RepID=UPI0025AD1AE8|nr:uncharacterized protein LOC130949421 [Arachis stenosperma]